MYFYLKRNGTCQFFLYRNSLIKETIIDFLLNLLTNDKLHMRRQLPIVKQSQSLHIFFFFYYFIMYKCVMKFNNICTLIQQLKYSNKCKNHLLFEYLVKKFPFNKHLSVLHERFKKKLFFVIHFKSIFYYK